MNCHLKKLVLRVTLNNTVITESTVMIPLDKTLGLKSLGVRSYGCQLWL